MPKTKRQPGALDNQNHWLVLSESKAVKGKGYRHSCGRWIQGVEVYLTVRDGIFPLSGSGETRKTEIPYCPACEEKPTGGHINPDGSIVVYPM